MDHEGQGRRLQKILSKLTDYRRRDGSEGGGRSSLRVSAIFWVISCMPKGIAIKTRLDEIAAELNGRPATNPRLVCASRGFARRCNDRLRPPPSLEQRARRVAFHPAA